ncbi:MULTISPECIES: iron uptake porin [unclassified Nodularia (in: cyanobacteria)]|uniref:iron uptake porin n=1 Tax=unclassified Nodularia (in: cyanobacteria) TaxID=2656917 RepID=UPI00187F29B4|nr:MULTISPECIES: iron uptake porin [unclassified Nodularia (in: cyanobacteria)]MBE9200874.1 iron uptake porin [Nodularia sp. LEGE 06071]MCC2692364.1 iron uptake porin [Nodularia sp. LEGE 04288]
MSKSGALLPLNLVILGCNLLVLQPVLAQANPVNTPLPEIKINATANLLENNEATSLSELAANSDVIVRSTDKVVTTNQSRNPSSVTTFNSSDFGEESLGNFNFFSSTLGNQVSSDNQLPSINSDDQLKIPEIPTNQLQPPQLYSQPPDAMTEVTRVEDLRDVLPGDWAYEALQSLVEKYRCIIGSEKATFEGNRAINRYEFAAAFNTCLIKMGRIIYSLNNIHPNQEDLVVVKRLQADFATELKTLTTRIDDLEQRVAFVDDHQFSTTTVLRGFVDFNFISAFGDKKAVASGSNPREDLNENPTLSAWVNLNFDTSFTGKDRLRTNILAGNVSNFGNSVTGTEMTRLIGAVNTANNVALGSLFYEFPIGGTRGKIAIASVADFPTRIFPALNPVAPISNFGAQSPIYSFAFGTGAIVYYNFTDKIAAGVSYLTTSGNNPFEGLFGGQSTALGQVTYTPSNKLAIAFTYGHYYALTPNVTGSKGSRFAQLPFGGSTATSANAYGLQSTYKLSNKLILGGWVSYFNAQAESSPSINGFDGSIGANADIWSWAITAAVPDLGKLGSQLNFVLGMPPKVTSNDISARLDRDTSMHFELSYRYRVSNRVFLTPGVLLITNPEHNAANDNIWIGLLRTTFTF